MYRHRVPARPPLQKDDGAGRAQLTDEVHISDVDAELERRSHQHFQPPRFKAVRSRRPPTLPVAVTFSSPTVRKMTRQGSASLRVFTEQWVRCSRMSSAADHRPASHLADILLRAAPGSSV